MLTYLAERSPTRPWLLCLAAAVTLTVLAVLAGGVALGWSDNKDVQAASAPAIRPEESQGRAAPASRAARRDAHAAQEAQARARARSAEVAAQARARALLAQRAVQERHADRLRTLSRIRAQARRAAKATARARESLTVTAETLPAPHSLRAMARKAMLAHGFAADQWPHLDRLIMRESSWNPLAINATSGAYGLPQALPGDKMSAAGADWRTNPATQIDWMLGYISDRYGTPAQAWAHSEATGWY